MISKQKAFNKSLVDENTQIIFLDEAHAKLMDADDCKILTHGGLTAHDRKYKTSSLAVIRCPMFIRCQTDMDFGWEHNGAMAVRLRKFFFKCLTSLCVAGVQEFLQTNAMDCIVWACGLAITPDDELPPPVPGTNVQQGTISEKEKERTRTMQLDESRREQEGREPTEPNTAIDDSNVEGNSEESDTAAAYFDQWEESLKNIARLQEQEPCHSLKQRQLGLLAAEVKRTVDERESREEHARLHVLEEAKERWISLGMLKEEDAHLLQSVNSPYHPNVEHSRDQYFAKKKEDQRLLETNAREYFNNEWIMEKEKELRDLQKKEDAVTDEDV